MFVIFKVRTTDNIIRSISTLQRVNSITKFTLIEYFYAHWDLKSDNYNQLSIDEVIFNYKIIDSESVHTKSIINKPVKVERTWVDYLKIGYYNFPMNMDLFEWAGVDFIKGDKEAIVYKKYSDSVYHVYFTNKYIMSVDYKINNRTIVSFTDEFMDVNNLGTFKRTIKNQILYFRDGRLEYREKNYLFPVINKLQERPHLINKFITMDLETLKENGVLIPYAVSIYDGKDKTNNFFLLK